MRKLLLALSVLFAASPALAAFTNDGSGGSLVNGVDSTGAQHSILMDTSGDAKVITIVGSVSNVQGQKADGATTAEVNPVLVSGWAAGLVTPAMESLNVTPAGSAGGTPNVLVTGGQDGAGNIQAFPVSPTNAAFPALGVMIAGGDASSPRLAKIPTVVPIGSAVGATSPLFILGGEDDTTAGAGNARAVTVATSGTAFGGTTPTVLEIGGMDNTAVNSVPRVLPVVPGGGGMLISSNFLPMGGTDLTNGRPVTVTLSNSAPNGTPTVLMVGDATSNGAAPTVNPIRGDSSGFLQVIGPIANGASSNTAPVVIGGTDGTNARTITVAPNGTTLALGSTDGAVMAGAGNGTVNTVLVVPAGGTTGASPASVVMGGVTNGGTLVANPLSVITGSGTWNGVNATATSLVVGGVVASGNNTQTVRPLPVALNASSTAVNRGVNFLTMGGTDGANGQVVDVLVDGAVNTSQGVHFNTLMVGGEDGTATNHIGRTLGVGLTGAVLPPNTLLVGGSDGTNLQNFVVTPTNTAVSNGLQVLSGEARSAITVALTASDAAFPSLDQGGRTVTVDIADLPVNSGGSAAQTSYSANTSTEIGASVMHTGSDSDNGCWRVYCTTDVEYRRSASAIDTAVTSDAPLAAKTVERICNFDSHDHFYVISAAAGSCTVNQINIDSLY